MNGKPGDHPLTDIFVHNKKVFGDGIDELIVELSKLVSREKLDQMFDWFSLPRNQEFKKQLQMKLKELRKEAKELGWEVD